MKRIYVYTVSESRSEEVLLIIAFLRLYWDNFSVICDPKTACRLSKGQINPHCGFIIYVEVGELVCVCKNIFELVGLFEREGLIHC